MPADVQPLSKRKPAVLTHSRSALLAFKLREFLATHHAAPSAPRKPLEPSLVRSRLLAYLLAVRLPKLSAAAQIRHSEQDAQKSPPRSPKTMAAQEDMVWVDAFFYGFYLEKSKVAAYEASLPSTKRLGL